MVARVPEDFQSLTNEELFDQNKPIISLILHSEKIKSNAFYHAVDFRICSRRLAYR